MFAIVQIGVGGVAAQRILARGLWRRAGMFVLLLIALWFVCSGLTEVVVSGMEASRRLWGTPGAATFALWRGRADAALLSATILLALALLAFPLLQRVLRGTTLRK